jgi:hypothetical protein
MLVIVLLAVTVKIPKMMRRWAGQTTTSGGALASFVRVVVIGGLTRAIPGAGRGVKVAGR